MKSKLSFTWHEKSFFLIGLMAATLFFVWAGMLQAPKNSTVIYPVEAVMFDEPRVPTTTPPVGDLVCLIASPEPHVAGERITFLAVFPSDYQVYGWDAGLSGDPEPRFGDPTRTFETMFHQSGNHVVTVYFSPGGKKAECSVKVQSLATGT